MKPTYKTWAAAQRQLGLSPQQVKKHRLTQQAARVVTNGTGDDVLLIPDDWCLRLALSYPTRINALYANAPGGGRTLTTQGRAWKQQALLDIQAQLGRRVWLEYQRTDLATRLFTVTLTLYHHHHRINPKTGRPRLHDIDGPIKITLDALEDAGLYHNDTQVFALHVHKRGIETHVTPHITVVLTLWQEE